MIAKRPMSRTRWNFDRLDAMFKDQEANKLTDEAVFIKHGGKGNVHQFAALKKRYKRELAAKTDPTELELIDFITKMNDLIKEKNHKIAQLEAQLAATKTQPMENTDLVQKLLNDQDMRAKLLTALLSKSH